MNIHQFKPGDLITRTEPVYVQQPAEYNHSLGIKMDQEPLVKFDFVGQKLILLGICNGVINIKVVDGYSYHLPLHKKYFADWSEGWAMYEPPLEVEFVSDDPEKPKRDRNWLWVAYMCFLISFIGLVGNIESGQQNSTIWIMVVFSTITFIFCAIWHYFPSPDWKE